MKLIEQFNNFMNNEVNLNQSRIDHLKRKVEIIENFIKTTDSFKDSFIGLLPQGSWLHKTIIKPNLNNNNFDADVLCFMKQIEGYEPKDYIEKLYQEFKQNSNYADIVYRKTRCVRIDYIGEFHIDIVPYFERDISWLPWDKCVTNRLKNIFEATEPKGFVDWFNKKNNRTKGNLKKVIRLVKYLRDIKITFSAKSVLLTTLLGRQIDKGLLPDEATDYQDLPTSLLTIMTRLNNFLQANPSMPTIHNPSLNSEHFVRHWDQHKYSNFREMMNKYTEWIADAYKEADKDESIKKWRRIFGDNFAKGEIKQVLNLDQINTIIKESIKYPYDLSTLFIVSHRVKPESKWKMVCTNKVYVEMYCVINGKEVEFSIKDKLPKECDLRFKATTDVPSGYDVFCQVVNTGREAELNRDPRGKFYSGQFIRGYNLKTERSKYKGVHYIECFIVKDGRCMARSGEKLVVIGDQINV